MLLVVSERRKDNNKCQKNTIGFFFFLLIKFWKLLSNIMIVNYHSNDITRWASGRKSEQGLWSMDNVLLNGTHSTEQRIYIYDFFSVKYSEFKCTIISSLWVFEQRERPTTNTHLCVHDVVCARMKRVSTNRRSVVDYASMNNIYTIRCHHTYTQLQSVSSSLIKEI